MHPDLSAMHLQISILILFSNSCLFFSCGQQTWLRKEAAGTTITISLIQILLVLTLTITMSMPIPHPANRKYQAPCYTEIKILNQRYILFLFMCIYVYQMNMFDQKIKTPDEFTWCLFKFLET